MHQFEAQLKKGINRQGWTYIDVPASVCRELNRKGKIKVCGNIDAGNFRSSFLPKGDGTYYLFVNRPLLKMINKTAGDYVTVTFAEDTAPRTVDVPDDIRRAFAENPKAEDTFTGFSYSHKKELMEWINDAKKEETRKRRIVKAILMLENYKKQSR